MELLSWATHAESAAGVRDCRGKKCSSVTSTSVSRRVGQWFAGVRGGAVAWGSKLEAGGVLGCQPAGRTARDRTVQGLAEGESPNRPALSGFSMTRTSLRDNCELGHFWGGNLPFSTPRYYWLRAIKHGACSAMSAFVSCSPRRLSRSTQAGVMAEKSVG